MNVGNPAVEIIKTERFENWRWGIRCCCCGQRIPKGVIMAVEIRNDTSRVETDWLYTRHYLRCPSSSRPHGFNVDLAHAIIKLTDNLGAFRLDNIVTSPSGRRASTLTLPEIVHACTESLRLLSGPSYDGSHHRRRRTGDTSHQRIAAEAAAADPASFLEDVAAEASSRLEGGEPRQEAQLRIKRVVCKATIEALFPRPSPAGHLLTASRPGCLVVLPSPAGAPPEAAPVPRPFPRRVTFAPVVDVSASALTSEGRHSAMSPAAMLLDTCPPPVARAELCPDEDEMNWPCFADKKTPRKAFCHRERLLRATSKEAVKGGSLE